MTDFGTSQEGSALRDIRYAQIIGSDSKLGRIKAANELMREFDSLLARIKQLERELEDAQKLRDEVERPAVLDTLAEYRVRVKQLEGERDALRICAYCGVAFEWPDGYQGDSCPGCKRAEAAERENERLREALRPFAENWDFHAADYLAERIDGVEMRCIDAATVADMIAAVELARAALARTEKSLSDPEWKFVQEC